MHTSWKATAPSVGQSWGAALGTSLAGSEGRLLYSSMRSTELKLFSAMLLPRRVMEVTTVICGGSHWQRGGGWDGE
jgi:hypothetical protein